MTDNVVTTIVQSGESLGLYAKLYNCSIEEITKLNKGKIGKNGQISEGAVLTIPIGKKHEDVKTEPKTIMEQKLNTFNDKLEEAKLKIYNPDLSSEEREQYEQEYINLLNMKKQRDEVASISLSEDKKHFDFKIKKDIKLDELRRLFPELRKNFSKYSDETRQTKYVNGVGFVREPSEITIKAGANFSLESYEYAYQGFWNELITNIKKACGLGEFD